MATLTVSFTATYAYRFHKPRSFRTMDCARAYTQASLMGYPGLKAEIHDETGVLLETLVGK